MSISFRIFGHLLDNREVVAYTMKNAAGMEVEVIPFGCRFLKICTPDKDGNFGDVILGHSSLEEYYGHNFQGSFVGRYANRIAGAEFEVGGKTYRLEKNNGRNTVHSGEAALHQVLWNVERMDRSDTPAITFSYLSKDGECGFPGNLSLEVTYSLSADNALQITYRGISDKETPFNPTNHSFFNLSGNYSEKIYETELMLCADFITEVDDELIPTGKFLPVKGTPYDFTTAKTLGKDIFSQDHGIQLNGGYDHNFCIRGNGLRFAAKAYCPASGRCMEVFSDMPGIQLYTFNRAQPWKGKDGKRFKNHTAFCLETQFFPDSVHHPEFPFEMLQPGIAKESTTIYRFSVE